MLAGLFLCLPTAGDLVVRRTFLFQDEQPIAVRAERVIVRPGEVIENGTILI